MSSGFVPVGPSLFVRLVIGPLSKLLNPLVGTLAGRRFTPVIARVHHVGRRSGKPYVTSTGAGVAGNTIVIPLTFGNRSDWARNVRAAGQCVVQLGGKRYRATQPQYVDAADGETRCGPIIQRHQPILVQTVRYQAVPVSVDSRLRD